MRHYANIMRPTKAQGSVGNREGQPEVYIREQPFSYKQLTGAVQDQVNGTWVSATGAIEVYSDPSKPILPGMYFTGGTLGDRRLTVVEAPPDDSGVGRKKTLGYQEVRE